MRKRLLAGLALVIIAVAVDLRRPPSAQFTARIAIGSIDVYQATLARIYTRMGVRCRFTPSCSQYSEICIRDFGAARGGWLSLKRVLRCGPWTPFGTVDIPPQVPAATGSQVKIVHASSLA